MNFSFCFLSAYTSYRPLGPARESACALPLALGVGGHGGGPSPGSPGSAGRTTARASMRALSLFPVLLLHGCFCGRGPGPGPRDCVGACLAKSAAAERASGRARQPRSRSPGVSDSRQKVRPDPTGKESIRAINRMIHLPSSVTVTLAACPRPLCLDLRDQGVCPRGPRKAVIGRG